jgi:hypothetical protein
MLGLRRPEGGEKIRRFILHYGRKRQPPTISLSSFFFFFSSKPWTGAPPPATTGASGLSFGGGAPPRPDASVRPLTPGLRCLLHGLLLLLRLEDPSSPLLYAWRRRRPHLPLEVAPPLGGGYIVLYGERRSSLLRQCAARWSTPSRGSLGGARGVQTAATRRHDARYGLWCMLQACVPRVSDVSQGCCKGFVQMLQK